jgi:hypothetical protein
LLDAAPGRLEQGRYGEGGTSNCPGRRFGTNPAEQMTYR